MHKPAKTTELPGPWRVELEATSPQPSEGPILIRMRVHNQGDAPATFCRYHTPYEGIRNDIFIVERGKTEIPYQGKMAKRAPPGPQDHTTVKPGRSTAWAEVDLTEGYTLKKGEYTVRFRGSGIPGLPDSAPIALSLE